LSKLTLSFKGTLLRIFPVLKGSMVIGQDPACTIHIDSLALSPQHARIDTEGDTSVLVDLQSGSGTFVNNKRIEKHILADGDLIRVGKHTLTYAFKLEPETNVDATPQSDTNNNSKIIDPPAADSSLSGTFKLEGKRHAWLQIMTGQNLGKTLSLNRAMTNLGKPGVATAVITRRNEGYYLSHLEGKCPPVVGDKAVGDHSVKLEDGDTITLGNIKMQFFLD